MMAASGRSCSGVTAAGLSTGSGSSPGTDGTNLARRGDVVVVSINHRLNVLGFTNLVEAFGRDYAQSGDVGMLDIVQALKWVRTNIERFGGDPEHRDDLRPVGRRAEGQHAADDAVGEGAVSPRDDRERRDHQAGRARPGRQGRRTAAEEAVARPTPSSASSRICRCRRSCRRTSPSSGTWPAPIR